MLIFIESISKNPNIKHPSHNHNATMQQITLDPTLLQNLKGKTAILTGAAGGIGLATTRLLLSSGANVVMADMPHAQAAAEEVIASLPDPSRAMFVPTDTVDWGQMTAVFRTAKERFGSVEVVVANAGVMESEMVLDVDGDRRVDENGDLEECGEFSKVVDVNVKGTMNSEYLFTCLFLFVGRCDTMWLICKHYIVYHPCSPPPKPFPHERQPSLFPRRISRLNSPGNIDFRILRGHRCRRLHYIKARDHRSIARITSRRRKVLDPNQCCGAIHDSDSYG